MYSYCVCTVFSGFWLLDSGFLCLPSRLRVPGKTYSCATQIVEFTLIPKINDAFVRPLYWVEDERELLETPTQIDDPAPSPPPSDSDASVMDATSIESSGTDKQTVDSDIFI